MRFNLALIFFLLIFLELNYEMGKTEGKKRKKKNDKKRKKSRGTEKFDKVDPESLKVPEGFKIEHGKKVPKQYWEDYAEDDWVIERDRLKNEIDELKTKGKTKSKTYLDKLHQLGRAYFRANDFNGAVEVADEILAWNKEVNGDNSEEYARALQNVAIASEKVDGGKKKVSLCLERALKIVTDKHGQNSREQLMTFTRMVQFGFYEPNDKPAGITQKEFEEGMANLETDTDSDL